MKISIKELQQLCKLINNQESEPKGIKSIEFIAADSAKLDEILNRATITADESWKDSKKDFEESQLEEAQEMNTQQIIDYLKTKGFVDIDENSNKAFIDWYGTTSKMHKGNIGFMVEGKGYLGSLYCLSYSNAEETDSIYVFSVMEGVNYTKSEIDALISICEKDSNNESKL